MRRGIRVSSISRRPGRYLYTTFLGVPIIDRGVLQGVLVVQTADARTFGEDDVRMLTTAGTQLASIVSEARNVGHFVAPLHQKLRPWRRTCGGGRGTRSRPASSARLIGCGECDHNPIVLLQENAGQPTRGTGVPALAARAHQVCLPPHAGVPPVEAHLGSAACERPGGAASRLLLGRIRAARIAADRSRRALASSPVITEERLRPRYSAGRHRALLRPGLFPAAPRCQRLAARGLHRRRRPPAAHTAGDVQRHAAHGGDRHARAGCWPACGVSTSAATCCCSSIRTWMATVPRIAS